MVHLIAGRFVGGTVSSARGVWMGSVGGYIFRTTFGAFVLILFSLTAVIWITNALRDIDLMTSQGQTVLAFLGITSLVVPQLMLVIAPIALVIAVCHVLNKLATDSELIVLNAAGASPWRLFSAFATVAVAVSLLVLFLGAYLAPRCLLELRAWASQVRADLVTNIIQPGRFTNIERGLTFHIRERKPNGLLLGIFVDDRREATEQSTFLAEQGRILENGKQSYLLLENGSVQRRQADSRDPTIVNYDRYPFDLSRFTGTGQLGVLTARERYLWDLISPDPEDPVYKKEPGQFRSEFHDRLVAPLYPIAFVVLAFAYLGAPRTTRQSRNTSLIVCGLAVAGLRFAGFVSTVLGINMPIMIAVQYVALAGVFVFGLMTISRGTILEPPAVVTEFISSLTERFQRRVATS